MALPWELHEEQCAALTAEFAALLAQRYRTHTAWSVHRPDKRGDARNKHSHIVVPTRELDDGGFGKKLRILDDHKTGRIEIAEIRKLWERTANTHLERAGHAARVDVSRREDGNPAPTLGRGCTAIEREAAVDQGERVENRSVADLVSTGDVVTWRGRALRRHQLREGQRAPQEARAQPTAHEQKIATIAVVEAAPQALAAPIRVGIGAPRRARPAGSRREARAEAVARPARIGLEQRGMAGRRALRVHAVQAHTAAEPVPSSTPVRRLEGAAGREVRVRVVATPVRIELQLRMTVRRGVAVLQPVPVEGSRVAEVQVAPVSTPAPIDLGRVVVRSGPAVVREVQPVAASRPASVVARRRAPTSPRPVTVRAAEPAPVVRPVVPVRQRQEMPRLHRAVTVHDIQVQTIARPVRVRLGRASLSQSMPAEVEQARAKPATAPRRPSTSSRPVASAVRVLPVRVASPAAPQEQDLTALETPPSLQEIADRLYEEVYAGQDAEAAIRPADPQRGLAIGFANWPEVQSAVQHDGALCGNVAASAAGRAEEEGEPAYAIHDSWADRIADWIREHVAAALERADESAQGGAEGAAVRSP